MKRKQEAKKWVGYLSLGVILIVLYKTLDNFTDIFGWIRKLIEVLMPFIIAVVIAYILYIPARSLEKKIKRSKFKFINKIARVLSVIIVYLVVFFAIFISSKAFSLILISLNPFIASSIFNFTQIESSGKLEKKSILFL